MMENLTDVIVSFLEIDDGLLGEILELGLIVEIQVFAFENPPIEILVSDLVLAKPLL